MEQRMQHALLAGLLWLACSPLYAANSLQEELALASETPPSPAQLTLRASEVLPQQLLSGNSHEVVEFVPVEDDRCLFTIRTDWGQITALGKPMLELRLREIAALELAKPTLPNGPKTPIVTVSSIRLKSASLNPRGRLLQPVKSADLSAIQPEPSAPLPWGNPELRRTAFSLGCDPETTQPLVLLALENLAQREDLGDLLIASGNNSRFPTSFLAIPKDQREFLATRKLEDLQNQFEIALTESGVEEEVRQKFSRQLPLTTAQKWLMIRELQSLRQTPGAVPVFNRIVNAVDELAALEILQELRAANNFQAREPLQEIKLSESGVELHAQRGQIALVRLGDYLTGNPPFQQEIERFRARYPDRTLLIVTPAQISPDALKVLKNSHVAEFAK